MNERRHALLIANKTYEKDSGFASLCSPHADAAALKKVLCDEVRGKFDTVDVLLDRSRNEVLIAITDALKKKRKSDLLLIYFSGHGQTNDYGDLFLATSDSSSSHLEATAVDAHHISKMMGRSDAGKTVLVLDCCHAGAFPTGQKSNDLVEAAAKRCSEAGGSYVLMACGEFELAQDGVDGELSMLTRHFVRGLQGAADINGDGAVTANELATYLDQSMSQGGIQKFNQSGRNRHGKVVLSWSGVEPFEDLRNTVRTKVLEWAGVGAVSDIVLTDVLQYLSDLKFADMNGNDQKQLLIRRLAGNDVSSGDFNLEWLQAKQLLPKVSSPKRRPKPEPEPEPDPKTKIQQDLALNEDKAIIDSKPVVKNSIFKRYGIEVLYLAVVSILIAVILQEVIWAFYEDELIYGDDISGGVLGILLLLSIAACPWFAKLVRPDWTSTKKRKYYFWRCLAIFFLSYFLVTDDEGELGVDVNLHVLEVTILNYRGNPHVLCPSYTQQTGCIHVWLI